MAASREEVYERVKEVLSEQLGVDESEINEEASFQGDLDADSLENDYPDSSEGRLVKIRWPVVSRASCADVPKELDIGTRLLERGRDLTPAEELQRLMKSRNVLAALLEASLAALFIEHGFQKIEPAIVEAFAGRIEYALTSHVDFKTELQEALARRGKAVSYSVLNVDGAPHDRTFT